MKKLILMISIVTMTILPVFAGSNWTDLEQQFRGLPVEARKLTGPLFWMHGTETQSQLENTLQKALEGGNGMFVTEPRPHNDWLGEGWYRDVTICLDFARKNNMKVIIYDDYWWPSQMMGGRVPPEYGSKIVTASAVSVKGPQVYSNDTYSEKNLIAVIAGRDAGNDTIDGSSLVDLTRKIKNGVVEWDVPEGSWRIIKFVWEFKGNRGAQQKMISVDGASPDCVDWFINEVYQPHYDRFGKDFGKTIVGYFYDEPETQGDWGSDFPKLIAERKLDLAKLLVAYKFKLSGEEQEAAFYSYLDTFAESWGRTMYGGMSKWCKKHGVYSMGHFMEHGGCFYSRDMSGGNMMQLQKYSDMGGMDLVCRQLYPGQRKMGEYQMPKMTSSVSHIYDKKDDISFCEIYGGYNQNLTYPDMKWLADWHHVRGVNMLITHSINPRAPYDKDYPPYFYNGGFEPRWPLYRVWSDYTSRLSLMLTGGHHVCPVAFLQVGQSFHVGKCVRPEEFTSTLQDALFDCDWMLYDAWENDAVLKKNTIRLHKEDYKILVVPPVEVIPYATLVKARDFLDKGGIVVGYDFLPSKSATPGKTSTDIAAVRNAIWSDAPAGLSACRVTDAGGRSYFLPAKPTSADLKKVLTEDAGIHPTLEVLDGDTGDWLHVLHRVKEDRDVFLVCNQNHEGDARAFRFRITAEGEPEIWDPIRNEITAAPIQRIDKNTVEMNMTLEPMESVLVVFSKKARVLPSRLDASVKQVRPPVSVTRDITPPELIIPSNPESKEPDSSTLKLRDCSWVWFPEGTPPPGTRFFRGQCIIPASRKIKEANYIGTCDNAFTLYVNGAKAGASSKSSEGWRSPTKIDLSSLLKEGANVLAIAGVNMSDAPNPAGLMGCYSIQLDDSSQLTGAVDASWKSSDKEHADWNKLSFDDTAWQKVNVIGKFGCPPWGALENNRKGNASPVASDPFCGHFELPADISLETVRVYLETDVPAPEAAASIKVNGKYAGGFIGKPCRLEITEYLKADRNEIIIEPFAPKTVQAVFYAE